MTEFKIRIFNVIFNRLTFRGQKVRIILAHKTNTLKWFFSHLKYLIRKISSHTNVYDEFFFFLDAMQQT